MKKILLFSVLVAGLLSNGVGAQENGGDDHASLGKALAGTKISLTKAMSAGEKRGKVISGKYELEKGNLQLSLYTEKAGKFYEVIVDYKTGKISNAEEITDAGDLKDAQSQSAVMSKSKRDLDDLVRKALKSNKGFIAVSAIPVMKDDKPVVKIEMMKGNEWKSVEQAI